MSKVLQQTFHKKIGSLGNSPQQKKNTDKPNKLTKKKNTNDSAVVYLGHLPESFEEDQITGFLSQFGTIVKCRVSRSRKTGRPRGYGFVQFADAGVANVVAETMSGYFVANRRIVCHVLPKDNVHPKLFHGVGKKRFKVHDRHRVLSERITTNLSTAEGLHRTSGNAMRRDRIKRNKLAAKGIDYDYPSPSLDLVMNRDEKETQSPSDEKNTPRNNNKRSLDPKSADAGGNSTVEGETKKPLLKTLNSKNPSRKKSKRTHEAK